jgi:hypothetical protein
MKNTYSIIIPAYTCIILSGCISSQPDLKDTSSENHPPTNSSTINIIVRGKQSPPNFSGRWILAKELSDDPQEKFKEIKSHSGKSGKGQKMRGEQGGQRKGSKQGGGKKNHSSGGKRNRQDSFPDELQVLLSSPKYLKLKHEEPILTFITKNGYNQRVYTDFRGTRISAMSGIPKKIVTAGWEKEELVIETTLDSFRLIQRYKLHTKPKQLWVSSIILISSLPKAIQFNQVYRPAETKTRKTQFQ